MIQRRLYIYIVAAASIAMVLIGLINLGSTALNQLLNATPPYSNVRDAYAGFGAVILVGLPVWGVHWWLAQRFAARTVDERASAIRRLYLYVVLAATGIALAIYLRRLIEDATGVLLASSSDGASITRALWAVLVLIAFWLYHFRTAALDRTRVGESGVSATLRRWYAYGLLFLGLAFLLFGARNLLQQIWVLLVDRGQVIAPGGLVPTALATMLTGLLIWGFHSQWTARPPIAEDDQRSTLRAVQRFLGYVDRDINRRAHGADQHARLHPFAAAVFDKGAALAREAGDLAQVLSRQQKLGARGVVLAEARDPLEQAAALRIVEILRRQRFLREREPRDDILVEAVRRGAVQGAAGPT